MSTEVLGSLTFIDSPTAGGIGLVLNSNGVPSLYADITANRPAAANTGRLFIDTTTLKIQRDNGSSWDTLADFITYTGTANQIGVAGSVISLVSNPIIPGTGGMVLPTGTTAQRGSSTVGNMRWNTTLVDEEIYDGAVWRKMGTVLQVVSGNIAPSSGSTTTPLDNTIPQVGEGNQIFTISFTPVSASSKLIVTFGISHASSIASATNILALFTSASANALATVMDRTSATANTATAMTMTAVITPGSTAAITISARLGGSAAATTYCNQTSAATLGGLGTFYSITEVL